MGIKLVIKTIRNKLKQYTERVRVQASINLINTNNQKEIKM